jgi:hypothetical protein
LAKFQFVCDESYDSDPQKGGGSFFTTPSGGSVYVPRTYLLAGFFAHELTWEEITARWKEVNDWAEVTRYHAAYVNARAGEFAGWPKEKQIEYSKRLLQIILDQSELVHVVAAGMEATEYYSTINEFGRRKLGSPYIACFKALISQLARQMESGVAAFAPDDQFDFILDQNGKEEKAAIEVFYKIKSDREWPFSHRLGDCGAGSAERYLPLQCADMIAYESFRLVQDQNTGAKIRKGLELMFQKNRFLGYMYDRKIFDQLKTPLETAATCIDNGFVANFPMVTYAMDAQGNPI